MAVNPAADSPRHPARRAVRLGGRLLGSLLIGLLLAEAAMRVMDPPLSRDVRPAGLFVPHPEAAISYTLHPGFDGQAYGVPVTINAAGFRGPDVGPKPPRVFRLGLVGDSVVFGFGLRDRQTLPVLLAEALGIEVLNLGVPGYNLEQQLELWRRQAPAFDLDAVVFVLGRNDTDPVTRPSASDRRSLGTLLHEARKVARAHSRLWAWLDATLWRRTPDMARVAPLQHPDFRPLARELDVWDEQRWDVFARTFARLADELERSGVPWMVAEYDGAGAFADALATLCAQHQVPFVPLTMAFDDPAAPHWRLDWDPHPSADADAAMAACLAASLVAEDLGGLAGRAALSEEAARQRLAPWRARWERHVAHLQADRETAVSAVPAALSFPADAVPLGVAFGVTADGRLPYREARLVLRGPGAALSVAGTGGVGATLTVSVGPAWQPVDVPADGPFSVTLPLRQGAKPRRYLKIGLRPEGEVRIGTVSLVSGP